MYDIKKYELMDYIVVTIMIIILFIIAYPLWFTVIASVSEPALVATGKVTLFPKGFTLLGYEKLMKEKSIWRGYLNSILYTSVHTLLNLAVVLPAAYSFSRKNVLLSPYIMKLFVFTMFFSGGLIPTYLMINNLKLLDTMWAIVLPGLGSVYNIIVARTFFKQSIPYEVQESAKIDGCSDFMIFFLIMLPLSKAIIAVIGLFCAVAMWNSYFSSLIYLTSESKFPLQIVLRQILIENTALSSLADAEDILYAMERQRVTDLIKYGLMVVASIPMILAYPFVQKYFIKGVMIGSVKG